MEIDTEMKGLRKLFGEEPNEVFTVNQIHQSGINTFPTVSKKNLKDVMRLTKNCIMDEDTLHPYDDRFYQVPAKMLVNANGDIIIITKIGIEIIIQKDKDSEDNGLLTINEFFPKEQEEV